MAAPDSASGHPARIAVFDLDGTITRRDTHVPYLAGYARRHPEGCWRLWRLPFTLMRFAAGFSDSGRLKSSSLRQVMLGARRAQVLAWSDEFCRSSLPALLIPRALDAIAAHRLAGDRLVLLSAAVDLYVPTIGRCLGFDETICTGISWHGDSLEGRLTTPNRHGAEKRRVIDSLRARHPGARLSAYGNAATDLLHLAAVDDPLVVNANGLTLRRARALGLPCADWRRD
jgi:HAD superfamily hydrolase (TIGR01490 family)